MLFNRIFPYAHSLIVMGLILSGIVAGGIWAWSGILVTLIWHPLVDLLVGRKDLPSSADIYPKFFDLYALLIAPISLLVFSYGLYRFLNSEGPEAAGIIISIGMILGFAGITTAHELVHRQSPWHRRAGFFILCLVNYGHFGVEHVYGHHKNVATPEDPVTARKNEWVYTYWVRAVLGSFIKSLGHEHKKPFYKNRIYLTALAQLALAGSLFYFFGVRGAGFYLGQGLVAALLLESVEYIEHYGLVRRKRDDGTYEPPQEHHSWDCDYYYTNATLINLGYHSYHHRKPLVKYEDLTGHVGSRMMPLGYSGMIVMAMIPPLFFKIMNPRLEPTPNQE